MTNWVNHIIGPTGNCHFWRLHAGTDIPRQQVPRGRDGGWVSPADAWVQICQLCFKMLLQNFSLPLQGAAFIQENTWMAHCVLGVLMRHVPQSCSERQVGQTIASQGDESPKGGLGSPAEGPQTHADCGGRKTFQRGRCSQRLGGQVELVRTRSFLQSH